MARSCPVGGGARARGLIITAIVLAMTGGSISAASAASVKTQSAPVVATNPVNPYAGYIAEASRRFGIPESWIRAVMRVESRGQVKAVSPKGAIGLMQIMPDTWTGLRLRYRLGRNPRDPRDNILAGAAYLREMLDRYGAAGFLAAYNAGPGRYAEYLATGRPLPAETLVYVAALAPLIGGDPVNSGVVIAAGAPHGYVRHSSLWLPTAPHPHIGRNRTVDCTHVRLPISPGWNRHMIGIRATCCAAHRCSLRRLPAVPRTERRDRSGVQISERRFRDSDRREGGDSGEGGGQD